ncbi:hypothetical protein [Micromonospora zhanjiangensis]
MTPEELQRALRDSMSRQVAAPPAPAADRAGAVISRGRRAQRLRTGTGVALAAVATAVVSVFAGQLTGPGIPVIGDPFVDPTASADVPVPDGPTPGPTAPDGPRRSTWWSAPPCTPRPAAGSTCPPWVRSPPSGGRRSGGW